MREIKFRGISKRTGKFVYGSYIKTDIDAPAIVFGDGEQEEIIPETLGQFTGLKDKNGVEIYECDLLNVFHTSGNGEHVHDCIYKALIDPLSGFTLRYERMLWESYGHNQYPINTRINAAYGRLGGWVKDDKRHDVAVMDTWSENHMRCGKWKGNDFSTYIEVIGNIYENPELLEQ